MKVALISCGRSDFSIYFPLIKALQEDTYFKLHIIAFGTHVSVFHGHTVDAFFQHGFPVAYQVESLILGDSAEAIATAMGTTVIKFSSIWSREQYDLIIVLGDRYEMFSAIAASVPFNIPVAHIHGGETTLGAIDDKFRHALTSMSKYHFTSTEGHKKRVTEILGHAENVYNVGALALDNIKKLPLLSIEQFKEKFGVDLSKPTILSTFHPETVSADMNLVYTKEILSAFDELSAHWQILITMPNADTMGNQVRQLIHEYLAKGNDVVVGVESLGLLGYYSCMKYCHFLLGNTSSGIIEAASFGKYVINLGNRQKGREAGQNVLHCAIEKSAIIAMAHTIPSRLPLTDFNIYGKGEAAQQIIKVLKEIKGE
jgi:GDP/UDP-N,N'-diacetylbacillosamine 2-epimerase (hydrolysing)